ncbi:MAG: MATE family efflux transporter [Mariniblastus sp.]|nr:MATE family efflux transporter [Mariniblastus sp.]
MYRTELKQLATLAIPLVLAQLAQNTTSFVDSLMVGRLGKDELAGIAVGSTVFHFVAIILSGVILGVSPIVSQASGANDEETSSRAVRQGLWLGALMFLPAFILFWNAYPILIWLQQTEATAQASSSYLRAISWGLLPALWIMALRGYLEGKSNTHPIMLICFVGVGINIIANDFLMFGRFGLPELGLVGTGYASSLVYFSVFVMLLGYIAAKYKSTQVFARLRSPDFSMLKELFRVGAPISATLAFEGSMFSAAALAMGTLGKDQLAAHQIALQTASITFMIPLGLAIATSVRVGQAIGSGSPIKAEVAGRVGMLASMAVMCVAGVILFIFPKFIVSLYIDTNNPINHEVISFAISFLSIAAVFQVVDGLQVTANGSLRGLKDTKAAMILTLISYWGAGSVAGVLLCFNLGQGGRGLWWGMTCGLATAAVLLSLRFHYRVTRAKLELNQEKSSSTQGHCP